ncbi:sugar-binding domain-containing protein [Paenibacillus sp. FSL R5-0623]|uniref:glycoside hydrolase family 2 protein n=1 Tax=Paenibacillus sp. FSL R5-0623 TaxID=2921651 RepID=UPI0030D82DC5
MLREDYPRPQFVRQNWMSLNGQWEFEFDDDHRGRSEKWSEGTQTFSRRIQVPFAFQSQLSGIGDPDFHDNVWYKRTFEIPDGFIGKRLLLHFGAVDYEASVWVNGQLVVQHEGGHTPFHADITDVLQEGTNVLTVQALDYSKDVTLPRGKQFWQEQSAQIFYTRTTGIWQSVWLEAMDSIHLQKVRMPPDIDRNQINVTSYVHGSLDALDVRLRVQISYQGEELSADEYRISAKEQSRTIGLHTFNEHGLGRLWSPEHPNLYDIHFTLLLDGMPTDEVDSYFGMRKISIEQGRLFLNNRPYFMKLVLDQGYFPDGNLTPPNDEAIRRDVELAKELGFNGARKHQKIEDPRYLYWCDKLGLMVWGEMANAYEFSQEYVSRMTREWQEAINRDYNHPCIVVWVPLNESWGVPNILTSKEQQYHALSMYYLTKSIDPTRPVISNDGWEMVQTDLYNIHDYEWRKEVLKERYRSRENAVNGLPGSRHLSVGGHRYDGQPILITEFGGIGYKKSDWEGWGYSGAENDKDFAERLHAVIQPLLDSPVVEGFCYTQLTDVEQEINGLLTYDRQPKMPIEQIRAIIDGHNPSSVDE